MSTESKQTTDREIEQIEAYLSAGHALMTFCTHEEDHVVDLLQRAVLGTDRTLWRWSVTEGLRPAVLEGSQPVKETEQPAAALYHIAHRIEHDPPSLIVMHDLAPHLEDPRTLRILREAVEHCREHGHTLALVDHCEDWPDVITADATHHELSLPDADELEQIVRRTVRRIHQHKPVNVQLRRSELDIIIRNLGGLTRRQAAQVIADAVTADRRLDVDDINHILARKRQMLRSTGVLEYVETPVDLSEIGGLKRLKRWLKHRKLAGADEAEALGLSPPRGVMMLGVQGAGKSMCAKAIATAWKRPLLRLDPGALYDRYIGESERRLRDALHQAEMMAPIILWIDEIEKGFASASSSSNDGGLSRRMFGTLLTWMQEHTAPVFLVATANDIEALPPELLRKGRFDEIFFVDLPGKAVRRKIFEIHLKKRKQNPKDFDLSRLADAADGYSGAEIEQAIIAGLHEAFAENRDLDTPTLIKTLDDSPPLSVTMAERIATLRRWADGRCHPAD